MPVRWAIANGDWSNTATWNDGATLGIPTGSDDIFTNTFNVNVNQSFSAISLNSTARARTIATPAMTADNAPSPFVAAASAIETAGTEPFQAFNRNYTTTTYWSSVPTTGWLSMDFGSGSSVVIDGYTIFGTSNQALNPRNWTFEGSNDNVNWIVLQTVTLPAGIAASGTYSISSIGNTTIYRYYRVNVSLNGGGARLRITELELYERFTAALAAGGSFIFNSGSISGSATSTTAALTAGATNLIQVTATTGTVTLNLSSSISNSGLGTNTQVILHSGNCNFNLNGQNFNGGSQASAFCINKTSAGTITITGNLIGLGAGGFQPNAFNSSNGNTVVIGNVLAGGTGLGITQTAGNITVTGNVTAAAQTAISLTGAASQFTVIGNITGGTATNAFGISHSGTSGSVIGNVTGGSGTSAHGISTVGNVTVTGTVTGGNGSGARAINTTGVTTITGNVIGGGNSLSEGLFTTSNATVVGNITGQVGWGVGTNTAVSLTLTGTMTAGSTSGAVYSTAGGNVLLAGNMINVSGRQAIFAQNLFISNAATSQWRLFTQGGQDKTLYSADTFPNQPSSANVRSGSLYGPANVLSGSMVVPAPSNVRVGVLTDNTVGTGQSLTAADFLAAISSSADPFAQRLRNVATVDTVGSLITGLNGGF